MKTPIRNKRFTIGIVLFLIIILLLAILSIFYLTKLSDKTSAILKENHYSVVYARNMSDALTVINQKVVNYSLTNDSIDTLLVNKEISLFDQSLKLEKNNITEIGEDALAQDIETNFIAYRDSVSKYINSPKEATKILYLQKKFDSLYQQLMLLSQMNEKAIEAKTDDAKVSAKKASIQMSVIGTLCFLIAYAFAFSFSSYFNERFYLLYDGLKEMVSSKYKERLYFRGKDEFYEMSLIINEMAEELSEANHKKNLTLQIGSQKDINNSNIQELKDILNHMKSIEKQANEIILKFENKK
jgi:hypothetical protein